MKKILILLLLIPFLSIAQIGINTTLPKAALDVESTNNGILIPRVQLTSALDITTVVNPAALPLETSTLVYNIAAAGVAPNNVISGFYYWNGSRWMAIAGNATADHDWYEEGTTTAPNAITDTMFHTGNVAIGKDTASTTLDIETTDQNTGITNTLIKNSNTGNGFGLENVMTINSDDSVYGIRNSFSGTGSGAKTGLRNIADASVEGLKIGIDNQFQCAGSTYMLGMINNLTHTGDNLTLGVVNYITNPLGTTGVSRGFENRIINNSTRETSGLYNVIESPNGGIGGSFGTMNYISGRKIGGKMGTFNVLTTDDAAPDELAGTYNYIYGNTNVSGSPSTLYGSYSELVAGGNTVASASRNLIYGSSTGELHGTYTIIGNLGNGIHRGIENILTGTGTGTKYGFQNTIATTAGGTHYGIHSTVLKPGATNFAGYFLGNVGIGTTTTNIYTFPASRGTNGQVIQTDGSGVLAWQNPNTFSWSLTGNAVNAATHFLGSTNDANVIFKRNNANAGFIGQFNTALGINTLPSVSGVYNVAIGVNALSGLGAADQNCAVGWNALSGVTTGGNNIGIGTNAQVPSPTGNNQIRLGNVNIAYAGIQVPWSVTSDRRWKENIRKTDLGLQFIDSLNPVSYSRKADSSGKTEYGFIAQELDKTLHEFGADNNGIITKDSEGMLSVRYNDLLAPIVRAIQELKLENDKLKQQNESLQARLKIIEDKIIKK